MGRVGNIIVDLGSSRVHVRTSFVDVLLVQYVRRVISHKQFRKFLKF